MSHSPTTMKTHSLLLAPLCAVLVLCQFPLATPVGAQSKKKQVETKDPSPFAFKNSKGKTYYLFSREQKVKNSKKTFTMYYFALDPKNKKGTPVPEVPKDRIVSETKNGLPVLKKKK